MKILTGAVALATMTAPHFVGGVHTPAGGSILGAAASNCTDRETRGTLTRACASAAAAELLDLLKSANANIATAESLTSGMIASILVDVPLHGSYIYGGFATYDSDAKRKYIGVTDPDVYSGRCALQMAKGALLAGRSSMAIAVTGQAGPVPDRAASAAAGVPFNTSLAQLGVVDFGSAIRVVDDLGGDGVAGDGVLERTVRWKLCEDGGGSGSGSGSPWTHFGGHIDTREACAQYIKEALADPHGYVSLPTIARVRSLVRLDTATQAIRAAREMLENDVTACHGRVVSAARSTSSAPTHTATIRSSSTSASGTKIKSCIQIADVPKEVYDGEYLACDEPSPVISSRLEGPAPSSLPGADPKKCDDRDVTWPTPSASIPPGSDTQNPSSQRGFATKEFVGGLVMGLMISAATIGYHVYRSRVRESTRVRMGSSLIENEYSDGQE